MRKMKITGLLVACMLLFIISCKKQDDSQFKTAKGVETSKPGGKRVNFVTATINSPGGILTHSYTRLIRLANGNLFACVVEEDGLNAWPSGTAVIKCFRSTNEGTSWTLVSTLADTQHGLGANDPQPYVLPVAMGSLPAGTLLMGVRAMGFVSANFIDVYKSADNGSTWTFLSNVAVGNAWERNVYEPFFVRDNTGRLLCYYSDERDGVHSQKLAYKASTTGGATWGSQVDVVAMANGALRPGMCQVTKIGNGQWMMTYEMVGDPNLATVRIRHSNDGYNWGPVTDAGAPITDGIFFTAGGNPSVMWTPKGSANGTIIVTAFDNYPLTNPRPSNWVNYNNGYGAWTRIPTPLPYVIYPDNPPGSPYANSRAGYSRSLCQSTDGNTIYHITAVDITGNKAKTMFAKTPVAYLLDGVYSIRSSPAYWNLINRKMEVSGMSTADGALVQQWDYFPNNGQKWEVTKVTSDDYYKIINVHSGRALDVPYGAATENLQLWQYGYNGNNAQLWKIEHIGSNQYKMINKATGKCVTIAGGALTNGAQITQTTSSTSQNQLWYFELPF